MPVRSFAGAKSIDASLVTVVGSIWECDGCTKFGLQVILGGTVVATGCVVTLQGTLDGTNYFTLATWDVTAPLASGAIVFAVDKPVRKIRANCTTLSGGTAPTVTAYLSAA